MQLVLSGALLCPKSQRKNKRAEKTVPQSTENCKSKENAVPGGSARAPFQDPASALYPLPLPRGPMGTTHPPIIHTSGHLVPPPRRSARGQAGLLFLLLHMGVFFPSPRDDKNGGNSKVFKRVASKCLTSMYAFTCRFPKSTVGGFFVFIDWYLCIRALRRLE